MKIERDADATAGAADEAAHDADFGENHLHALTDRKIGRFVDLHAEAGQGDIALAGGDHVSGIAEQR